MVDWVDGCMKEMDTGGYMINGRSLKRKNG
jgi:hypothetical protein